MNKRTFSHLLTVCALVFFMTSTVAQAQTKRSKQPVRPSRQMLKPDTPTPINENERTINDLLWFAFGCMNNDVNSSDEAKAQLITLFNTCENINGYVGLHAGETYKHTYRGAPIAVNILDCFNKRQWYCFYFNNKSKADQFYTLLAADIRKTGIPLVKDNIYGGLSNRRRPVSVFKWVYVSPAELIKKADESNIHGAGAVGMYVVELGVYKR